MCYLRAPYVIVILEWIFYIISAIAAVVVAVFNLRIVRAQNNYEESVRARAIIYVVFTPITILIGFLLNSLLMIGVKRGHSSSLKIWSIANIVLTVLFVLSTLVSLIGELIEFALSSTSSLSQLSLSFLITILISGAILWYKIWSIKSIIQFRKELTTTTFPSLDGGVVYSFPATPRP